MRAPDAKLSCPSAQPDMTEARVLGIVGGTVEQPRVDYLKKEAEVSAADLQAIGGRDLTQVLRFSARCESHRCGQFKDGRCSLASRIVQGLAPVVDSLPPCQIRATCRWYAEEGREACLRCPQVVTLVPNGMAELGRVAALPEQMPPAE